MQAHLFLQRNLFLDFFDTIFIVARRKWTQISFLHLYHHTTIFLVYLLNVNFNYFGDIYLTIVLNGTIHAKNVFQVGRINVFALFG